MILYKKQNNAKDLNDLIKSEHKDIYKEIYDNHKDIIMACVIDENQKNMLDFVNKKLVRKYFNDEKFLDENHRQIDKAIEEELSLENLMIEFELYNKKKSLVKNHEELSYQEIMALEYDEDEALYTKDFNIMLRLIKSIKNLYLWGNAGNGKTTFAYNIARELGLQLYNINSVKNEFSVKGFFDLEGKYNQSLYEKWYSEGGLLLLDECDSYSSNGMLYLNNGIEVSSKYLTLEDGSVIHKNPNCYVIACANTDGLGKTSDYIGRNAIDKAFMSRFTKKEYKEYAHVHKQILGKENYKTFKGFFNKKGIELTCRLCVKIKGLLETFTKEEIKTLIENKEIELWFYLSNKGDMKNGIR